MKDKINKNYYQWDISKGDYYRDYESTLRYDKKVKMNRRIKGLTKIFIYMGLFIGSLSFLAFYLFN